MWWDSELFVPTNLGSSIFDHKFLSFVHVIWKLFAVVVKRRFGFKAFSLYFLFVWFFYITCSIYSWRFCFSIMIEIIIKQIICFSFKWIWSTFWRRLIQTRWFISLSKFMIKRRNLCQMLHNVFFFAYLNSYTRIRSWTSWIFSTTLLLLNVLLTLKVWWR